MSFFDVLAWGANVALEHEIRKAHRLRAEQMVVSKPVKSMFPFTVQDVVGENGTNILKLADIGSGKTNAVGQELEMFLPMQRAGNLSIAVFDPKGEMLERLPPGLTEMFDSQRYMAAWPIVEYFEELDPETIADDFLDDLASGWHEKDKTARLDRHVHYAMQAAAEHKIPVPNLVKIVEGARLPTINPDLRVYWERLDNPKVTPAFQLAKIIESSQNRLSPFSQNSLMRRLCFHKIHWSIDRALQGGYSYWSLPVGKPLSEKRAHFLTMIALNSLIRRKERLRNNVPPLLLVIDEG
jgi:hypothetical protein